MWDPKTWMTLASPGQLVLIDLIGIAWNNSITTTVASASAPPGLNDWLCRALEMLDDDLKRSVGSLVYAMFFGSNAVENWLKTQGKTTYPM